MQSRVYVGSIAEKYVPHKQAHHQTHTCIRIIMRFLVYTVITLIQNGKCVEITRTN